ncbi:MAG: YggS family pyridoxal phosphate-dependent enzyme [Inhella sp.]
MSTLQDRLRTVHGRIDAACRVASRARDSVQLLCVSKTQPAEAVRAAWLLGERHFGENYVQEGVAKIAALRALPGIVWHCIGPLQSNKTRLVAEHFDWVHSVDSLKLAKRLSDQRPAQLAPLQICLQVNTSGETSKSGVAPPELPALAGEIAKLPRLQLRGLMHIPAPGSEARVHRQLADLLQPGMDQLSMGMSDDLEAAVAAGSTMVRIGTAVFGQRP